MNILKTLLAILIWCSMGISGIYVGTKFIKKPLYVGTALIFVAIGPVTLVGLTLGYLLMSGQCVANCGGN